MDQLEGELQELRNYYSKEALTRDKAFLAEPVLFYEQHTRQRIVSKMLERCDLLMDLGCGNFRDLHLYAAKAKQIVGVDFSPQMLKEGLKKAASIKHRVDVVVADATQLPFRECCFDLVLCSEAIEHIPRWQEALRMVHRVLKDNGKLILTTPNLLSLYGLQKPIVERVAGGVVPYDSWKTWSELRDALNDGFVIEETYGACILPGHISHFFSKLVRYMIVYLLRIEERLCAAFPWRYLMYMLSLKARKLQKEK
jgi:demethylmenaquinone methyltransferase/2-methoxy-6-polyprenyl-1,4-benzoquinol methylase